MKIILTTMCFALIISCKKNSEKNVINNSINTANQASKTDSIQDKNPETIDDIKKNFTILNEKLLSKKLDSTSFNYNCDEIEGEVHLYYENQKLKIVKHFFADSHFSSTTKYYVKNDNVFFIFKDDTLWQFDGGTSEKPITKDSNSQLRIYLANNKTLKCLEKNYTIRSEGKNTDPEKVPNKETKCDAKELITTYQSLIKNKDKKGSIQCL